MHRYLLIIAIFLFSCSKSINKSTVTSVDEQKPTNNNSPLSWKPVGGRIMTTWGEAVRPENVLSEYPRPQFSRKNWLNLNGLWDYSITPKNEAAPNTYQGKILVPFCVESALSGVGKKVDPASRIWYKKTFTIPEKWNQQNIVLNFGAVDYETHVFVNDALVGSHKGGFDGFFFDITEYLKPGENTLVLSVYDPTTWEEIPTGKQRLINGGIWYSAVSGIWQTVWLEPVSPELFLEELKVTPNIDRGEVTVETHTNLAYYGNGYGVKLTVLSKGQEIVSILSPINHEAVLKIPSQHLWSPDDPFLYDLNIQLYKLEVPVKDEKQVKVKELAFEDIKTAGNPLDVVDSYFGMRKMALGKGINNQPVMYLNNKPLFQNGTLDQGWWPDGLHTPPSEEAMLFDLKFLKEAGFNMLRKHMKVEPARYYYNADKLGLLIWQDMPASGSTPKGTRTAQFTGPSGTRDIFKKASSAAQFELEYRRIIRMLYNHPSVVSWVTFNEGWGQYETGRLTEYVRGLDQTRLINSVSGWTLLDFGDVYDIHTYEAIPKAPKNMQNRAIVVGEYGGIGYAIKGHLWNINATGWGYQSYEDTEKLTDAYRKKFTEIIRQKRELGISASVYTQTTDVQGESNGLLTYDRKVIKIPVNTLKKIHQPVFE